ncbi:MAG: hypothetical protein RIF33_08750 [Cyclobacteriaceae bacterium]
MTSTETPALENIKWPEIISLAGLNAAVVISWIAYHEYLPVLVEKFDYYALVDFIIGSKAIILVVVPPLAGWLADYLMQRQGKYFTMYTIGIGVTAMIFMVVASLLGAASVETAKPILPVMIILWLVAMNLFISPANSMIEAFAPVQKLPVVVGFLFLITELLYALEPVVVDLVRFFGPTLTFIVGGVLISVSGYFFQKVSSDEVILRKQEMIEKPAKTVSLLAYLSIVIVGLELGIGKGFLVEYFPHVLELRIAGAEDYSGYIALGLLAFAAILGFGVSGKVANMDVKQILVPSFVTLCVGVILIILGSNLTVLLIGGVITAAAFSLLNITGLPYAFQHLSVKHITYGVGIYIGASELFTGLFEYLLR